MNGTTPDVIDLRPVLLQRIARLRERLNAVAGLADPDAVHDYRVASRELLACRPLLQAVGPTRLWRRRVRKVLKSLNRLRDIQQMQERLGTEVQLLPLFDEHVQQAVHRWHKSMPALAEEDFTRALKKSARKLKQASPVKLLVLWHKHWQRSHRQVHRHLATVDASDLRSLHRLRVSYKKWRYLMELLLAAGAPLGVQPPALKAWQEQLGEVEDFRVMAVLVAELGGPAEQAAEYAQAAQQRAVACVAQLPALTGFLAAQQAAVEQFPDVATAADK